MKITDLQNTYENYKSVVKFTDLDHFFNVYLGNDGKYKFNLNASIYLEVPYQQLSKTIIDGDYHWPTISYKLYGTTRLAWMLMKLNNVKAENVFARVPAGMTVFHLSKDQVESLLEQLAT